MHVVLLYVVFFHQTVILVFSAAGLVGYRTQIGRFPFQVVASYLIKVFSWFRPWSTWLVSLVVVLLIHIQLVAKPRIGIINW